MKNIFKQKIFLKYLKISIFLLEFIGLGIWYIKIKENSIKVCLCIIGKKENLYVREFIEHYKKYGVDKIFLYDNNDIAGEHFDDVLSEYIYNDYVKIINYRGKNKIQLHAIKDCYKNNYMNYDWFLFYDMDEFIYLKDIFNIKKFLKQKLFNNCQINYS